MKNLHKFIAIMLCCFMSVSLFSDIKLNFNVKADSANYWDVSLSTLESETNGTDTSAAPEITVFTYGCGGELFHWCNNGKSDAFNYDEDSMVTALQERFGTCKLFKVSFDAGQDKNVDTKSKKD